MPWHDGHLTVAATKMNKIENGQNNYFYSTQKLVEIHNRERGGNNFPKVDNKWRRDIREMIFEKGK